MDRHPDRAAAKSAISRNTFQGDGFGSHETELVMHVHDILLETFEIKSFFLMRRDSVSVYRNMFQVCGIDLFWE